MLSAVRAASRMRMTGAHWTLLLTTGRDSYGSPRSQRAQLLYAVLEQVAAQHAVPADESATQDMWRAVPKSTSNCLLEPEGAGLFTGYEPGAEHHGTPRTSAEC
ncbi:hypothetical protein [Streptomyces sp. NPDC058603]|uniref:hypothetical protein n=1 Tax=Streptomyces sp. NPDC058603 TaxID=3346551 RepID=UPI003652245A